MDAYTKWCCDSVFTPDIVRADAVQQEYCDLHLTGLATELGLAELTHEPKTAHELNAELGFVETGEITLEAMLLRLARRTDHVEMSENGAERRYAVKADLPDPSARLGELRSEMEALGDEYLAGLDFMDFGAKNFRLSLKDDPEYMDRVLSGRQTDTLDMWSRTTNADPIQDLHGAMGAQAILDLFQGGTVLEVGGGTGNGIRHLFRRLDEAGALDRVEKYVFTDISVQFMIGTRKEIGANYPSVKCDWKFLDINKPLTEQKFEPESVDLIYGVNAAHVAKDIVGFLKSAHAVLRPGGRILFAERLRRQAGEMAPRELALNLSEYHRNAAIRNSDYRPDHCYLVPENWGRVFELAGFQDFQILPDLAAVEPVLPSRYAGVVTAVRPA